MNHTTLTIRNETGLHSRPADLFVRTAKLYESRITIHRGDSSADAKNIIKVILLNVSRGTEIRIEAEGPDEDSAIADLSQLVESDFRTVNDEVKI